VTVGTNENAEASAKGAARADPDLERRHLAAGHAGQAVRPHR
jgi:hypothetical protein